MTHQKSAIAALTIVLALAGCTPVDSDPVATPAPSASSAVRGAETCELATGAVSIEVPAGFVREESSCVWDNGDAHLSLYAAVDGEIYDVADHLEEARGYEGVGGDEEVSDLDWQRDVALFASQKGDVLSYRTAADGDPLRIIVAQSADYQLFYVAGDDDGDGRELFLGVAATITAE